MTRRYSPAIATRFVAQAEIPTPLGAMVALATEQGLAALWFDARERYPECADVPEDAGHPHIAAARRWLDAYWAGDDTSDVDVPLDLHGSLFQRAVWAELQRIPRGRTRTYGEVAAAVGSGAAAGDDGGRAPSLARATGSACGANPVGVIVPCHRVVGANGSLTGFAAGLPRKEKLLVHEGVLLA
jgi:methylated-DNA-[protein]-cysteine S-methyltransferase